MKKSKKILLTLLLCTSILVFINIFSGNVLADVGSFESYDGGGSWDSDWDSRKQ